MRSRSLTLFATVASLGIASLAAAEEAFLSLYMGGKKIGYTTFHGTTGTLNGRSLKRSDSTMLMSTSMMGSDLQMKMDSTSWSTADGKPVQMIFRIESGGRVQLIKADFGSSTVKLVIDNSGEISRSEVKLPTGAPIVDDALGAFVAGGAKSGTKKEFWVLDPTTATFTKNSATVTGKTRIEIKGKKVLATHVTIHDPRADTEVYLSAGGQLLKAEGPMGIVMLPEPRAMALNMKGNAGSPKIDISEATSIHPDQPLHKPGTLTRLQVMITGHDLASVPSDSYQQVKGSGKSWTLDVHPPNYASMNDPNLRGLTSPSATWLKPSMHVDSDNGRWSEILRPVLANKTGLKATTKAVHDFVYHRMQPNAGIGVLRDAEEIYRTKEGVCRDYAVLTATLMRSAGVPTRLASGLVSWDGTFYYHAWVEVWDGKAWYPVDSTSPDMQVSAAHIKLSQGNVEEAFSFPFLGSVKMKILSVDH